MVYGLVMEMQGQKVVGVQESLGRIPSSSQDGTPMSQLMDWNVQTSGKMYVKVFVKF